MFFRFFSYCILFSTVIQLIDSAKILGIFAYTGKSHFLVFQPVLKELAARGHQLKVISYFEHDTNTVNYTGVLLKANHSTTSFLAMDSFDEKQFTLFDGMKQLYDLSPLYENAISRNEIQLLANEKYDLIITEMFNFNVMYGLIYKIGAPVVGFSSCELMPWVNDAIGNTNNPSYNPVLLSDFSTSMSLYQRIFNTLYLIYCRFQFYHYFYPEEQAMAEKYLGKIPNIEDIVANTSLILVNTHFSVFGAKPVIPNIIEVAGVHILPVKPLPKVLEESIGKYESVIYFSMGSVLESGSMSLQKRNIFLNIFSKLKNHLILWKSSTKIDNKPNNIVLSDWCPQRDILAHKKTVLFISHCGLLGTLEAIQSGVPILCLPMFGDQYYNAKAVNTVEISLTLQYLEITEQSLMKTIDELLNNPKYKKNAKRVANAFNDRPLSPMDTAIYWIEYVIRHNGAPLMISRIKHLYWFQYYNLDVIFIFLSILYLIYVIFKYLIVNILIMSSSNSCKKVKTS